MSKNLEILPIRDNIKHSERFKDIDETLPKPPFRWLILAPSGSGKTLIVQNLILNEAFYKDMFDMIVVISPTIDEDVCAQHLRNIAEANPEKYKLSSDVYCLEATLDNLKEYQSKNAEKDEHILLILDDCAGQINKGNKINSFIMKMRHYRISIIICSQYYKSFAPTIRENTDAFICFKTGTGSERKKIIEEVGCKFPGFAQMYDYATDGRYDFLYCYKHDRVYRNFTELLYDRNADTKETED